jgi:Fe-Mn family superoxide dismutase
MFELKPLPYPKDALEPAISKQTVDYHYHKNHAGYIKKLNELLVGSPLENQTLETIMLTTCTAPRPEEHAIFNQAAQVWNHDFYWQSLSPEPSIPTGPLVQAIKEFPGDLRQAYLDKGSKLFGSGWLWFFADSERRLYVETTMNAMNPLIEGFYPLLVVDAWEHAYNGDYPADRKSYLLNLWTFLNWKKASEEFAKL